MTAMFGSSLLIAAALSGAPLKLSAQAGKTDRGCLPWWSGTVRNPAAAQTEPVLGFCKRSAAAALDRRHAESLCADAGARRKCIPRWRFTGCRRRRSGLAVAFSQQRLSHKPAAAGRVRPVSSRAWTLGSAAWFSNHQRDMRSTSTCGCHGCGCGCRVMRTSSVFSARCRAKTGTGSSAVACKAAPSAGGAGQLVVAVRRDIRRAD